MSNKTDLRVGKLGRYWRTENEPNRRRFVCGSRISLSQLRIRLFFKIYRGTRVTESIFRL